MQRLGIFVFAVFLLALGAFAENVLILFPKIGESRSEGLWSMMRQIETRLGSDYNIKAVLLQPDSFPDMNQRDAVRATIGSSAYDRIVCLNIDILGGKVFYNVRMYDGSLSTDLLLDNFVTMKEEDFEVIITRFTKMIGQKQRWASTGSINEITARDAAPRKQGSYGHFGIFFAPGIQSPWGNSLTRQEQRYFYSYDTATIQPDQFLSLSVGLTYDLERYFVDAVYQILGRSGMALGIGGGYYLKDAKIAPYAGVNLSAAWLWNTIPPNEPYRPDTSYHYSYSDYEYDDDVGLAATARLGMRFLRNHFFQPSVEVQATVVNGASRVEKFAGVNFGVAIVF